LKAVLGTEQVERAFVSAERKVKDALKKINREAGRLLANGDYAGMEALVQMARAVQGFQSELADLQVKWKDLSRQGKKTKGAGKEETTPLWSYYQPLLRMLVELGGDATRHEIENAYEKHLQELTKGGDHEIMGNGSPRWKVMIRRARKPMTKEGFLDSSKKGRWIITAVGRQAAQSKRMGPTDKTGSSI